MKILYCSNYPDGYKKISAIKLNDWTWGDGESLETFNILTLDMTVEQITDWENFNKYCVNEDEDDIEETPEEYQTEPLGEPE